MPPEAHHKEKTCCGFMQSGLPIRSGTAPEGAAGAGPAPSSKKPPIRSGAAAPDAGGAALLPAGGSVSPPISCSTRPARCLTELWGDCCAWRTGSGWACTEDGEE